MGKTLRIHYSPYRSDCSHASDRRRLLHWAKYRQVKISIDPHTAFDILYANVNTPIIQMERAKESGKEIYFEIVDGYHAQDNLLRDWLRKGLRNVSERHFFELKTFSQSIREKCKLADKVIAPNIEISADLLTYSSEVHTILDFHEEFPFRSRRPRKDLFSKLIWEGQTFTLSGLLSIQGQLVNLKRDHPNLEITVITDLKSPMLRGKYIQVDTSERLKELYKSFGNDLTVHPWSVDGVISKTEKGGVAMLPLKSGEYLSKHKPENRLLIMWRLGLPVIASNIPSYIRVMNAAGLDRGYCSSDVDWYNRINEFLDDPNLCYENLKLGQEYIKQHHNESILMGKWDTLFS